MKKVVAVLLFVIGFAAYYHLWPQALDLPKIGTVEEWTLAEGSEKELFTQEKPKLVTFFFTNCPDVCPMTIWDLKDLQLLLKEKGIVDDQYLIVAVTLDPEYDTDERILQYKENFGISNPNWLFLRGSEEETMNFTQYFNFIYEKDSKGSVTHSTSMYVVDGNDRIRAHHDMAVGTKRVNIEAIADHLQQLIK